MSVICECCAGKADDEIIEGLKDRSMEELHAIQKQMKKTLKATRVFKEACDSFSKEDLLMMEILAKSEGLEMPNVLTPSGREEQQKHMNQVIHRSEKGLYCVAEAIKLKLT